VTVSAVPPDIGPVAGRPMTVVLAAVQPLARAPRPTVVPASAVEAA